MIILFFILINYCIGIDLEDNAQDWIIESKQLHIPQCPYAFNPSIVRWNNRLLLSFRVVPNPKNYSSWIGLIWLNENFEPVGQPQRLVFHASSKQPIYSRPEDGRLITIGERLFVVYSDNEDAIISRKGFRMYIAEIEYRNNSFNIINKEKIISFKDNHLNKREKNWVPFNYFDQLLLAYSINPHRIVQPLWGTSHCEEFVETEHDLAWQWGDLRGGTQAIRDGDHYLAFFHSSIIMKSMHSGDQEVPHYFVGAYTFDAEPPFELRAISAQPLIGRNWYNGKEYKPYWKPIQVIFPCGLLVEDEYIYLTYGRQDHEMWVAKIDKKKMYESLIPIF
jgi:predicted GH43/DUF377 family glycosyl hydrolase